MNEDPAVEEDKPLDGVFVVVQRGEDGGISTDVAPQGDVRITEIQTILEVTLAGFRQKLGFGQQGR